MATVQMTPLFQTALFILRNNLFGTDRKTVMILLSDARRAYLFPQCRL